MVDVHSIVGSENGIEVGGLVVVAALAGKHSTFERLSRLLAQCIQRSGGKSLNGGDLLIVQVNILL